MSAGVKHFLSVLLRALRRARHFPRHRRSVGTGAFRFWRHHDDEL